MLKISIIVPCYGQAQYLDEALESVLNQTYSDWECIIINDGSPDNTEEIVEKWLHKDERFKYIAQKNKGVTNARNNGIRSAKGMFILPLDADDKISPNYLNLAVREMECNENLKLVYCEAKLFGEEEKIWQLEDFSLKKLAQTNMIFCSAVYRRRDWEIAGGYDDNMVVGWEDWEFWISLLKSGGEVKKLHIIGFYYRIRKSAWTERLTPQKEKSLKDYMSIKHADFFVKHVGSFFELTNSREEEEKQFKSMIKSEKYVIDLFLKTFFGLTLFGKISK